MPERVQYDALKKIPGFENVRMFRPGYAIEYDFFPPTQLKTSLETQLIDNLYFAGQINGTTGYEEAACQGLMAGINAHHKINERDPFVLKRSEAYIGVLIDDLVNKGTSEPYRMFTSRAEYRILLRQDNADLRLTEMGHKIGLASTERLTTVNHKNAQIELLFKELKQMRAIPEEINAALALMESPTIEEKIPLINLIRRPQIGFKELKKLDTRIAHALDKYSKEILEQAEILIKYEPYIDREQKLAEKIEGLENFKIRSDFDYDRVKALSSEAREKLKKIKPETIGQMTRISGVSPADVSVLSVYLGR